MVYLRSGPKMGNRSVHRSVPLRFVPIQDRRVKYRPSLIQTWFKGIRGTVVRVANNTVSSLNGFIVY